MSFYRLKHIGVLFVCWLFVMHYCGCSYGNFDGKIKSDMNDNSKTNSERKILEVYIAKDEKISISKKVIEFCELSDQIKNYLMSDTIVKSYIKVYPNSEIKMSTVNCIIEEVKKAGVDSLSLWSKDKDGRIMIRNDKQVYDNRITVYTVSDYSLIIDGDTVDLNKMEEKLDSVLDKNERNLIVFKVRKGLSYDSYKECEDVIKKIQKKRGSDAIHIKEDICPYCR